MCLCLFLPIMMWYRLLIGAIVTYIISIRLLLRGSNLRNGYGKCCMAVFLTAILLGGSIALLQKLLRSDFSMIQMMGSTLLLSFFIKKILQRYLLKKQAMVYHVILVCEETEYHMKALLDTGNSLVEPISKKPVCIIGKHLFEQDMVKEGERKEFQPHKFRAIPYHSVGKENGILCGYEMDRLIIDTDERKVIIEKPVIGISQVPVGSPQSYQMILQPKLLREGEN